MDTHGPKMTKLILKFMSRLAVPKGGGIRDGLKFFTDEEHRQKIMAEAEIEAVKAINLVRSAPDNPYGEDEEVIAGSILSKIMEREKNERQAFNK